MSLIESAARLGATAVAMVQARIELAAIEIEEESQRFLRYLVMALVALFLCAVAIVLVAVFVIVLFWDSYRLQATAAMAALFGAGGAWLAWRLRIEMQNKPPLLGDTVAELRKDISAITGEDNGT